MVLPAEPPGRTRLVVLATVPPLRYQLVSSLIQLDLSFVERVELFLPPALPPWDSLIRESADSLARVVSRLSPGMVVAKTRLKARGFEEAAEFFYGRIKSLQDEGLEVAALPSQWRSFASLAMVYAVCLAGGRVVAVDPFTGQPTDVDLAPLEPEIGEEKLKILKMLAQGLGPREIAVRLGVNASTVYRHISALRERGIVDGSRDLSLLGRIAINSRRGH